MKNRVFNAFTLLLLLVFVVRLGILLPRPATFLDDPDNYLALAGNINRDGVFGDGNRATAFRPPLYPLLLAGTLRLLSSEPDEAATVPRGGVETGQTGILLLPPLAIAWLHAVLGLFTVLLVFATARRLGLSERLSFLAAMLVLVDPILLQQSRFVMTETFATFFSALLLFLLVAWGSQTKKAGYNGVFGIEGIGMLLGLAVLCRPAFLVFALLVAVAILLGRRGKWLTLWPCLCLVVGCAIPLAFWTVRNVRQFHKPIVTTTHGGYTLLLANNRFLYDHNQNHYPWESAWNADAFHKWYETELDREMKARGIALRTKEGELAQNEIATELALKEMRARPKDCLPAMIVRVGNLWQCLPYSTGSNQSPEVRRIRYGIAAFYALETILALVGTLRLFRRRKKDEPLESPIYSPWLWIFMLILSVQLPHLVYWTNMRMRAVLVPAIALLCASAVSRANKKQSDVH